MGLGPVQGMGLALGVRDGAEAQAEKIKARCLKAGLIVAAEGEVVTLFPPLVIDEADPRRKVSISWSAAPPANPAPTSPSRR